MIIRLSKEKTWQIGPIDIERDALEATFGGMHLTFLEEGVPGGEQQPQSLLGNKRNFNSPLQIVAGPTAETPGISVSEFMSALKAALERTFPLGVLVRGVLSSVKAVPGGRIFMELADAEKSDETVRCVIWQNSERLSQGLSKAGFKLESELPVLFRAQVQLNRKSAQVSLVVHEIIAEYTVGKLKAERDATNERLRKEGLFELNRQKQLAFLPRRLGILTSKGGTVINDFRASLDIARFGFELEWFPVQVQGRSARKDLLAGIKYFEERGNIDALLIFRGGGSAADLAIFNDYEVARMVCMSSFPVCSAIGHEEDRSSVQDVSFLAAGVPKDLGRFFSDIVLEHRRGFKEMITVVRATSALACSTWSERLISLTKTLELRCSSFVATKASSLQNAIRDLPRVMSLRVSLAEMQVVNFSRVVRHASNLGLNLGRMRLDNLSIITERMLRVVERKSADIQRWEEVIRGASPEVQLQRGFLMLRRPEEETFVTRAKDLREGDLVQLVFADGERAAEILPMKGGREPK